MAVLPASFARADPDSTPLSRVAAPLAAAPSAPTGFLQTQFPATGAHETILSVPSFGRYAITVRSQQGTALQLVDRMAGPGDLQGIPGTHDGRIDAFLDRGTYKVKLLADTRGSGVASLSVTPSVELQNQPLALVEFKPVLADLGDHEQRSWWLKVATRGVYSFEAGGRYLDDLRLWQNGAWMVDAAPLSSIADRGNGEPFSVRQLVARLEPGVYRLTAYGGAGLPWSDGSPAKPFILRWGVQALADSGRSVHMASLLGMDRYVVPNSARTVRLVIDKPEPATLSIQPFDPETMFQSYGTASASIDKSSRDPEAELSTGGAGGPPWLVTVQRTPGAKYRLEILNNSGSTASISPRDSGNYLLATTLPGNADDAIDPGFLLIDDNQHLIAASAIDLAQALPWRRHFNLLQPVQTFLYASKSIDLRVEGTGANAAFVVDRFLTDSSYDRVVPNPELSGGVWKLTPGYYVLTAQPLRNGRGILTMSLSEASGPAPTADSARLTAPVFASLSLDPIRSFTLYSSLADESSFGLRMVELPATLDTPISLELGAGKSVIIPLSLPEEGQLNILDENGNAIGFFLDRQAASGPLTIGGGSHLVNLTGPGPGDRYFTISFTPTRLLPDGKLPVLPDSSVAAPVLPSQRPDVPTYLDLDRQQRVTFAVPVDHPALYRLETTGLLETDGAIRTRVNPSLSEASGNGIGRNFLLQQFLREGDYQLSVQSVGQTTGHLGISVSETPIIDGGELKPDLPSRLTLATGTAAAYHFHVPTEAVYRIRTLGLGHQFAMRLEDADGWPLLTPGGVADATLDFTPGEYRMILLPSAVENRAVTILQRQDPPATYAGHGPLEVTFGESLQNRWLEPAPGQPRVPDRWHFVLPAPATVTVTIDSGMSGRIIGPDGNPGRVALTNEPWSGKLPAGDYTVEATSASPNNRVDYSLEVDVAELIAGQKRDITAPATLTLSLGAERQYEISSFGDHDVRASLFDAGGHLVAANDDRADDWNFLIAGRFPAGQYTLRVDPVGTDTAATEVSVFTPDEVTDAPLLRGAERRFSDGQVHVMPVAGTGAGSLFLLGAASAVPVGLALEQADEHGGWRAIAATSGLDPVVALPQGSSVTNSYRLRAWALDHGNSEVDVSAIGSTLSPIDEASLAHGADLQPLTFAGRQRGILHVAIRHPAVFTIAGAEDTLQWSGVSDLPVAHDPTQTIIASGTSLWFVDQTPHQIKARHVDFSNEIVHMTLSGTARLALPLSISGRGAALALWRVTGQGTQPGITIGGADRDDPPGDMAVGDDNNAFATSVAYQNPALAKPVLRLWQAGTPIDTLPITVRRIGFGRPKTMPLDTGINDGWIGPDQALQVALRPGPKRLALTLPKSVVAVVQQADSVQRVILGGGTLPDIIETDAVTLLLLNPNFSKLPFSVSLATLDQGSSLSLAPGDVLTRYSAVPEIMHLAITGGVALPVRMAGTVQRLAVIDASGHVSRDEAATGGKGSALEAVIDPGLMGLSIDGASKNATIQPTAATPPAAISLRGESMVLRIAAADARLLHLETDVPVTLRSQGQAVPTVFTTGAQLNIFQPKGQALTLELGAVGLGSLSGELRIETIAPVPIKDGLGPLRRVAPGQSRLFSFSVTAARPIGVGVRGSVDIASCRLIASDGTELGHGLVQMHQLQPGTYYLAVDVPPDREAVQVQPALVGLTLPDDGPPEDVKDQYRELVAAPQD